VKLSRFIGIGTIILASWGSFAFADTRDTQVTTTTLTLEKSVEIAVSNATQVLQNTNQYGLTAIQVLQSYGQFLPNLSVNASYGYQTGNTLYAIDGLELVDSRSQNATVGISSTLNLFNGLADYSGLKSALARREATGLSLEWAKQQVALDITQTYLQLVLDEQLLDIAQKNLVASQLRLKLLQGQSEVGSASVPDLYRQQAETSADLFTVSNYESRVHNDQVLLLRKLRIDPSASYRFDTPPLEPVKSALSRNSVERLVADTVDTRSDVRSNESLVLSTDWDLTRAKSGYFPRLDLVFARDAAGTLLSRDYFNGVNLLNFTQQGLATQLGNQVEYSITLALTWNLFDRFATRLNVETTRTIYENTRINRDDSRLQVQADIRTAYTNYAIAWKQLDEARTGLKSAEKSYEAVQAMYEVGSSSIVDVLTAQAALVQARSNLAQVLTNLKLQERTLDYAVGHIITAESR
jgi:outer membrane protein